jgi:two-component sensor histidine kinase
MVSAIASQTLRGEDIETRRNDFNARLGALARAHDMLLATNWTSADLREVVENALAAHRTAQRPIDIGGPDIELSARQGMSMALATHELATTAAKYGALSVDGGSVTVAWSTDKEGDSGAPVFEFVWRERGGPPVEAPIRKGFGSRLITRALPSDFGGEVTVDYDAGGVVCRLVVPLGNVRPTDAG